MWDSASFAVGLILGMIIMLVIVWILFATRTFIFEICPTSTPICHFADYINYPGLALYDGANLNDILFLKNEGLYYKRVPRSSDCVPDPVTQTIKIPYPQYCQFTTADGSVTEGKQIRPGAPVYNGDLNGVSYSVMTDTNCKVSRSTPADIVASGTPELKWDVADPASLPSEVTIPNGTVSS